MSTNKATVIIGLSGPSSSGKTTLARLLREIFNSSGLKFFIIHEDDFYKTDKLIPRRVFTSKEFGTRELDDWDCVESIDLPLLQRVLNHVKQYGRLPEDFASKEDQNTIGESGIDDDVVQGLKRDVQADNSGRKATVCLLDGFLLYPDPRSEVGSPEKDLRNILEPLLDSKLFLSSTREQTIERRTKRTGYVTLEGFWEDPPGFVEDLVWPNYVKYHAWMFEQSEDTVSEGEPNETNTKAVNEGKVNRQTAESDRVLVGPGDGEKHLRDILPWAIEKIKIELQ